MKSQEEAGNSFHRILVIGKNTFREAIRDKVLYNLVLFVLLLTACAILLGDLTDGQEARTVVNIGLNAMLLFGAFISIFVGVGLVSKEIGLCLTLLVNVGVMGIGVSLALIYVGGGSLAYSIWGSILLIYLELTILTAVAILFSSFSSPSLSALLTFFVFIIGHMSASLRDLAANLGSRAATYIFEAIYYLLPNLSFYSFQTEAAYGLTPTLSMTGGAVVYAIVYITILFTISIFIFSRRNFK